MEREVYPGLPGSPMRGSERADHGIPVNREVLPTYQSSIP
ncbi:hypothetical protein FHS86_000748 [Roseimarinus sediminis]